MIASVADRSQIAEARRLAATLAAANGFDEVATGRIALVATEMATNLLKHASGGRILIAAFAGAGGPGLELIAIDKGPGIVDLHRALEDGASTAGTPGTGLGAMRRQSDAFALWSRPGRGTAVLARFGTPAGGARVLLGAVAEPYPGETVCGDAWCFAAAKTGPTLLLADGSGHGAAAAAAAGIATKTFAASGRLEPERQMAAIHQALAPTRGAAVAIASADLGAGMVRFVGVGNIGAAVVTHGAVKHMVSHNGTAGHVAPRIREFTYPCEGEATIILHSDGLSTKWDLAAYPGLAASDPSLLAAVLFRDHCRGKDDCAVAVMRVRA
jgi:anti-sigma regulatory factor (Ser/Thr protein kinase)